MRGKFDDMRGKPVYARESPRYVRESSRYVRESPRYVRESRDMRGKATECSQRNHLTQTDKLVPLFSSNERNYS
jgi:hypothetical protein